MNAFSEMLLGTKKQAESVQPQDAQLPKGVTYDSNGQLLMPSFVCEPEPPALIPLRQFVLAGRAVFNLFDLAGDAHHTYRVSKAQKRKAGDPDLWFVNLGVRYEEQIYLGLLQADECGDGQIQFRLTAKSRYHDLGDPIPNLFYRFWNALRLGLDPQETQAIRFEHCGICCVCARSLTDPVSVARGIGPTCEAGGGGG